ncbi:DUF475 domain-containing protein [Microbispora sp. NPDC049125]|uniref:DUF475 domain-containing protein n=1 Tax=Microbispora sp. NPDC049125 TaxID=3154929 RepID=UPI00346540AB
MILRTFGWSFGLTALGLLLALVLGGPSALFLVAILSILEISLSFDNAVVNAKVLERMSPFWRRMFLTVGIAVAVFGMRIVFPLLIVGVTARLNPAEAFDLALNDGAAYGRELHEAHPFIAAFGGMFLFMLFLDFIFEEREHTWLSWLERPLARMGRLDHLSVIVAAAAMVVVAQTLADDVAGVMVAGVLGIVTYLLVNGLSDLFGSQDGRSRSSDVITATGRAGFFLFLYIEILDASFSFDGVIGSFAISHHIFIIAAGLGIGAVYIRSLTVYLVKTGALSEFVYLEHGAHWAIGALAAILLISIGQPIPEIVTGLIGVGFLGAAVTSSILRKRRRLDDASPSMRDQRLQTSGV